MTFDPTSLPQRLYLAECRLRQKADLVIVNDDPARPELVIQAGRLGPRRAILARRFLARG